MEEALKSPMELFYAVKIIDTVVLKVLYTTVSVATFMASFFYLLTLSWSYVKINVLNLGEMGTQFFDLKDFIRTLVLVSFLVIYIPAMQTVLSIGETFNSLTAPSLAQSEKYARYYAVFIEQSEPIMTNEEIHMLTEAQKMEEQRPTSEKFRAWVKDKTDLYWNKAKDFTLGLIQGDPEALESAKKAGKNAIEAAAMLTPSGMALTATTLTANSLLILIAQLIKAVCIGVAGLVLKVLICLGPFAVAFSIIPMFSKQLEMWFSTVVGTIFLYTTLNVLDHIFFSHLAWVIENGTLIDRLFSTTYYVIFIVMYLMSFWLTSKIVGKGDAGRVLSKMVGIATAALGAVALGGGAAASKATTAGDVIKSGADALNE